MSTQADFNEATSCEHNHATFAAIVDGLVAQGYCVLENALPAALAAALGDYVTTMPAQKFTAAGVGRQADFTQDQQVRRDEICWIDGSSALGCAWLAWTSALKGYINKELFMGLFSFESHFAHYPPGAFYQQHRDAFKGQANRVVSLVAYLNRDWQPSDGGELVLYADDANTGSPLECVPTPLRTVAPTLATVVVFLSEDIPHEVLPAKRDRYSIAGWFRVNTSTAMRVDPPK